RQADRTISRRSGVAVTCCANRKKFAKAPERDYLASAAVGRSDLPTAAFFGNGDFHKGEIGTTSRRRPIIGALGRVWQRTKPLQQLQAIERFQQVTVCAGPLG